MIFLGFVYRIPLSISLFPSLLSLLHPRPLCFILAIRFLCTRFLPLFLAPPKKLPQAIHPLLLSFCITQPNFMAHSYTHKHLSNTHLSSSFQDHHLPQPHSLHPLESWFLDRVNFASSQCRCHHISGPQFVLCRHQTIQRWPYNYP